jgi:thiol-disulfide isomerase/thioredoxin
MPARPHTGRRARPSEPSGEPPLSTLDRYAGGRTPEDQTLLNTMFQNRMMLVAPWALLLLGAPFRDLSFDKARDVARSEKKCVMVDFFTTWCVPCKKLDATTWKDPKVQEWLGEKTVALKLDAEKEVELAKRYSIAGYPTILFVQPDGKEIGRIVGYRKPEQFLKEADDTLGGKDAVARAREELAGRENDPMARKQFAKALADSGRLEEALAEYLWCFDVGKDAASFHGVRVSFLLAEIAALGRRHPPAIEALEKRRDEAQTALSAGTGDDGDVTDLCALNKYLSTPEKTLALYDRMKADGLLGEELARAFVRRIDDLLIDAKRYSQLVEGTGDVEEKVNRLFELHSRTASATSDESEESRKMIETVSRQHTVKNVSKWYEVALATGEKTLAARIADKVIAFDPSGFAYATLIERASRAGDDAAVRALIDRGRASLEEAEQAQVTAAARKLAEER